MSQQIIDRLSDEAKTLLVSAAQDKKGIVMKMEYIGGFEIETNGKQLVERDNPQSRAAWEVALVSLCHHRLMRQVGANKIVFSLTPEGFSLADQLQ